MTTSTTAAASVQNGDFIYQAGALGYVFELDPEGRPICADLTKPVGSPDMYLNFDGPYVVVARLDVENVTRELAALVRDQAARFAHLSQLHLIMPEVVAWPIGHDRLPQDDRLLTEFDSLTRRRGWAADSAQYQVAFARLFGALRDA